MLHQADHHIPGELCPGWELVQHDWGLRQRERARAPALGDGWTALLVRLATRIARLGCPSRRLLCDRG